MAIAERHENGLLAEQCVVHVWKHRMAFAADTSAAHRHQLFGSTAQSLWPVTEQERGL